MAPAAAARLDGRKAGNARRSYGQHGCGSGCGAKMKLAFCPRKSSPWLQKATTDCSCEDERGQDRDRVPVPGPRNSKPDPGTQSRTEPARPNPGPLEPGPNPGPKPWTDPLDRLRDRPAPTHTHTPFFCLTIVGGNVHRESQYQTLQTQAYSNLL